MEEAVQQLRKIYQTYLVQKTEYIGKSILNNSSNKVFFALEEENILLLSKYTNLSEKEKIEIKSLKRGECLMFVGEDHILTKIDVAEFEQEAIT